MNKKQEELYGTTPKKIYIVEDKKDITKIYEIKLDKAKCCKIIKYASLYRRVVKGDLYYRYKYEVKELPLADLESV